VLACTLQFDGVAKGIFSFSGFYRQREREQKQAANYNTCGGGHCIYRFNVWAQQCLPTPPLYDDGTSRCFARSAQSKTDPTIRGNARRIRVCNKSLPPLGNSLYGLDKNRKKA
jgi:hypothetical protein